MRLARGRYRFDDFSRGGDPILGLSRRSNCFEFPLEIADIALLRFR